MICREMEDLMQLRLARLQEEVMLAARNSPLESRDGGAGARLHAPTHGSEQLPPAWGSGAVPRVAAPAHRRQRRDERSPLGNLSRLAGASGSMASSMAGTSGAAKAGNSSAMSIIEKSRALLRCVQSDGPHSVPSPRPASAQRGQVGLRVEVTPLSDTICGSSASPPPAPMSNDEAAALLLELSPRAVEGLPLSRCSSFNVDALFASPGLSKTMPGVSMSRVPSLLSLGTSRSVSYTTLADEGAPPGGMQQQQQQQPPPPPPQGTLATTSVLKGAPMTRDLSTISIGGICSMLE